MRRLLPAVVAAALVAPPATALAGGHRHFYPRVFIGAWGPAPPYYVPYPVYPYPPPYPPPPPAAGDWSAPPPEPTQDRDDDDSYGLVQLRGVPDGADVDLDGRFWLRARRLDRRWLALPEGAHRVRVRMEGEEPLERSIDVAAGKSQAVRIVPPPAPPG